MTRILCSDAGIDTDKNINQIKDKWRTIFDKYKEVVDHNNRTGNNSKSFEFYEDVDEFMATSHKVSPRYIKELQVAKRKNCEPAADEQASDDKHEHEGSARTEDDSAGTAAANGEAEGNGTKNMKKRETKRDQAGKKKKRGSIEKNAGSKTENGTIQIKTCV